MKKVLSFFCLFITALSFAQELNVDHANTNIVEFFVKATFNNFDGVTNSVDGKIFWTGKYLTNKNIVEFSVPLDSLNTGIGLRDSHMRNEYLNTKQFPYAKFSGMITSADSASTLEYKVIAAGTFTLHGISKQLTVNGTIYNYGKLLKLESTFYIMLSDFKIDQPTFLFNTVDNKIKVHLAIYFSREK